MFTNEESQYILNALDQEVRRTGLQTAAFALGIVAKLQIAKMQVNEATPEPEVVEAEEEEDTKKKY